MRIDIRKHPDRRRIYHKRGIGISFKVIVIIRARARNVHYRTCAKPAQRSGCGHRRTSCTENHTLLPAHIDADNLNKLHKARRIGVVPEEGSIHTFHDNIDIPQLFCHRSRIGAQAKGGFLVGDCHIDDIIIAMQKEILDLMRGLFVQTVFVIAKSGVYFRGQAVSKLLPQQTAFQGHADLTERIRNRERATSET